MENYPKKVGKLKKMWEGEELQTPAWSEWVKTDKNKVSKVVQKQKKLETREKKKTV